MVYDGKIILLIEGVDKFTEKDGITESRLKFWLPKYFPTRFRVILTATKGSQSYDYLKRLECPIIELVTSNNTLDLLLKSLNNRNFLMNQAFVENFLATLKSRVKEGSIKENLYLKVAVGCLCPYETPGIVEFNQVPANKMRLIINAIDPSM